MFGNFNLLSAFYNFYLVILAKFGTAYFNHPIRHYVDLHTVDGGVFKYLASSNSDTIAIGVNSHHLDYT